MKKAFFFYIGIIILFFACQTKTPVELQITDNCVNKPSSLLKSESTESIVFGPEIFMRPKEKPVTEHKEFTLQYVEPSYSFILENGDNSKKSKVSSCTVLINGETVVSPVEVDKSIDTLKKEITLEQNNEIRVSIKGKPDSYVTIKILEINTVTDIDGNVYQTVRIGNQRWMAENLKVTHYRNGDPIPYVDDNSIWVGLTSSALCVYENNSSNFATYGFLYNGYAMTDNRNIAPAGWHVPTANDWEVLKAYLGNNAGGKLKETGTTHWLSPNSGATNETGFTGLPGGYRYAITGEFLIIREIAKFWSTTPSTWMGVLVNYSGNLKNWGSGMNSGHSIRLVRD